MVGRLRLLLVCIWDLFTLVLIINLFDQSIFYVFCHGHLFIIIILESAVQGRERARTLSVKRPQPHTTNPWKEEKDKTVGDKKERADHANRKVLALLLKPASPTPSNTWSLRSFQKDREGHKASAVLKSHNEEARTSAYEQHKHHE